MGLQVRLRHALGERVVEIPPRAVDHPVVVGRAGDADVQVPSINVGPQHAVVFVHDGHWVVQDCSADHATYVNGEPLSGPRPLYSGDVIVLGTDANAPMIEVDPDGVMLGHVGDTAATAAPAATAVAPARGGPAYAAAYPAAAAAPPPPPSAPPRPYAAAGHPPGSRMIATGPRVPYSVPDEYEVGEDPHARERELHAQELADPWAAVTASAATRRRPRRQQKTSEAAIAFAVVAGIAIVGVVVYLVYDKRKQEDPAPVMARAEPKKAPVIDTGPAKRVPRSIFTDDGAPLPNGGKPPKTGYDRLEDTANVKRPAPLPDVTDDQPPRASDEAGSGKAAGKGKKGREPADAASDDDVISETDPTFRRVENAYYSPDPAKALLTFQAYEEEFPNKHTARIADYREAMLDKIWWDRIESLVEKRQELTQGIKETQLAIKEETEEAHKVTVLEPRLEEQKSRLASIGEKLTKDMGYTLTTAPPIADEAAMAELRAKRDKALYEPWKKRVLKHILDKHGDYPWANEK